MTSTNDEREAQDKRRMALIERIGTIADMTCEKPLQGELGDIAYDLLRQAAAQISSDRKRLASLPAPAPAADEAVAITAEQLGEIMQEEWGDICSDTGCHPLDIQRHGRSLWYSPRHWTTAIADRLNARIVGPTSAAGEAVACLAKDLGQLRQIFESWLARPANEQPVNPATGVRPFGTGDLRHLIDIMDAAQKAVRAAPQAPATGGSARDVLVRNIGTNELSPTQMRVVTRAMEEYAALANHSPDAGGVGEAGLTDAELQAGRRVRAFAKSPHCTIEDHDQIMTVLDALERCAKGFNALRPDPRGEG